MVSWAVRHSRLAVLKIWAVSSKSTCRLTKDRDSFPHPHTALATYFGLTPNLEWQCREVNDELSCHDFLRYWLQLLRLPKATRKQPDSVTACWQGSSLVSIYWLEDLSLPSPGFSRSTAAQHWVLGDPNQPSIDLIHLPLQRLWLSWALLELGVCLLPRKSSLVLYSLCNWSHLVFPHHEH